MVKSGERSIKLVDNIVTIWKNKKVIGRFIAKRS